MNLPSFLSWFSSNQKGLEAVIATNQSLSTELATAQVALSAETSAKAGLEAEITSLRSQLSSEQTAHAATTAKIVGLDAQVAELTGKVAEAEAKAANAEAAAAIKIGTAIGATMGIPAALAPSVEATKDKPDFSSMRGIEKVIAIERWEASQRNNLPKN